MHACHLRENTFAHYRLVGGNAHARIRLDHPTHIVQTAFIDIGHGMEMIFQNRLHTGKGSIARPFAQTVDGGMKSFHPTQYSRQHVAHGKVVIVVRMKIEVQVGITFLHLPHILDDLQRIEDSQRIGQHEPTDTAIL